MTADGATARVRDPHPRSLSVAETEPMTTEGCALRAPLGGPWMHTTYGVDVMHGRVNRRS
jgi:hypothetical protein